MKVYVKRGAPNHREGRLISALQKVIDEKLAADPEFKFTPAKTYEQLQELHTQYCTEVVDFEQTETKVPVDKSSEVIEPAKQEVTQEQVDALNIGDAVEDDYDEVKKKVNPLLSSNPKVRDYVTDDDGFSNPADKRKGPTPSTFSEPTSFDDSFQLPSDEEEDPANNTKSKQPKKEKPAPINPAFDDMDASKKRKSTKRFARFLVEGVCTLAERGFVWFANKDINDAKLAEYELKGQVDLSLLLTLEDGQQATVREWFAGMNLQAQQLAIISQEDRDDFAEALGQVMLEKGIAPTPMQELIMVTAKIFVIDKGLALVSLKMQTSSVLDQLKMMAKTEDIEHEEVRERQPVEQNVSQDLTDTSVENPAEVKE